MDSFRFACGPSRLSFFSIYRALGQNGVATEMGRAGQSNVYTQTQIRGCRPEPHGEKLKQLARTGLEKQRVRDLSGIRLLSPRVSSLR